MNVAVIGASSDPERYANKAQRRLLDKGYAVFPVAAKEREVEGINTYPTINDIPEPVDTATIYMGPKVFATRIEGVIRKAPRRVILNPGTEDAAIQQRLEEAGIRVVRACTLVLLATGRFEDA